MDNGIIAIGPVWLGNWVLVKLIGFLRKTTACYHRLLGSSSAGNAALAETQTRTLSLVLAIILTVATVGFVQMLVSTVSASSQCISKVSGTRTCLVSATCASFP